MKNIMEADKYGIDYNCGENKLVRYGKDFDTKAKTEELISDAGKKGGKQALDKSILNSDKENALYS